MPIEVQSEGAGAPRHGIFLLCFLVFFLFILFVLRFWYLQILHGEEYAEKSNATRTRREQAYATRGLILDLKGRLLAENRPAYCLALIREDCPDVPATLAQVGRWTGTPLPLLTAKYEQDAKQVPAFQQQLLVTDLSFEQVSAIEEELYNWPGVFVFIRQRRWYPEGPLFAHILGYVAEAGKDDLEENDALPPGEKDEDLAPGDFLGKAGLEKTMQNVLRGVKGINALEMEAHGRQIDKVQERPSVAGADLRLSLDIDLQKAASDALGEDSGCVVIMEPDSGKVRALVTHPSYDNNLFTAKLSQKDWDTLIKDPRHPLTNRSIQSTYPPGSVWKLIMAGLLLEQNISPAATAFCAGSVTLGTHVFRCHSSSGHGTVNMLASLMASCDVYYYEMSQKVGIDNITRFAQACGFGERTGIDLPNERRGLVPSKQWKKERTKVDWQRGDTLNTSIGQGFTLVTPVQMAVYVSALLNGGRVLKPSLIETEAPEVRKELPLTASQRDFLVEAMRQTASAGTARRIARPDAIMGGKTGTAQNVRIGDRRLKKNEMAYETRDHAWLTSWGKKDGKTYVVVVMVEHGGGGSSTAGPVTVKIYESLFGPPGRPEAVRQTSQSGAPATPAAPATPTGSGGRQQP